MRRATTGSRSGRCSIQSMAWVASMPMSSPSTSTFGSFAPRMESSIKTRVSPPWRSGSRATELTRTLRRGSPRNPEMMSTKVERGTPGAKSSSVPSTQTTMRRERWVGKCRSAHGFVLRIGAPVSGSGGNMRFQTNGMCTLARFSMEISFSRSERTLWSTNPMRETGSSSRGIVRDPMRARRTVGSNAMAVNVHSMVLRLSHEKRNVSVCSPAWVGEKSTWIVISSPRSSANRAGKMENGPIVSLLLLIFEVLLDGKSANRAGPPLLRVWNDAMTVAPVRQSPQFQSGPNVSCGGVRDARISILRTRPESVVISKLSAKSPNASGVKLTVHCAAQPGATRPSALPGKRRLDVLKCCVEGAEIRRRCETVERLRKLTRCSKTDPSSKFVNVTISGSTRNGNPLSRTEAWDWLLL
eukprot:comp22031_c0_seq1/m.50753 comp22031_c0_seq1/g.50753  ORF comp22031_c0_seq1/g.50753 comp22031_c0_seq1/m.50753 type:complete len:413 (+) comp22031_c0_seq1:2185-3423(+)